MSGAVIIAEGDQRTKLQGAIRVNCSRIRKRADFVFGHGGVFTVDHEYRLLDLNSFDFVSENRKGIEAELL